jgi:hypothetical protein
MKAFTYIVQYSKMLTYNQAPSGIRTHDTCARVVQIHESLLQRSADVKFVSN